MQLLSTLTGFMKAINENTPIKAKDILYANGDTKLGHEVSPDVLQSSEFEGLDASQQLAFRHALAQDLPSGIALIRGPAGTGKTKTIAAIIATATGTASMSPVLVVTQRNKPLEKVFEATMEALGSKEIDIMYMLSKHAKTKLDKEKSPLIEKLKPFTMVAKLRASGERPEGVSVRDARVAVFEKAKLVFSTIGMIAATEKDSVKFCPRTLIVDEAGATSEPETLVPYVLFRKTLARIVLSGDEKQLQPFHASNNPDIRLSLFERLTKCQWPTAMLLTNYRMQIDVSKLAKTLFYENLGFQDSPIVETFEENQKVREAFQEIFPGSQSNAIFYHVEGKEKKMGATSYANEAEAQKTAEFINGLTARGFETSDICVMAAYSGQRVLLAETLKDSIDNGLVVTSIDEYQGNERPIVLITLVRANDKNKLGFLDNPHRLCCALSRARFGQIIVGNYRALKDALQAQESKNSRSLGRSGVAKLLEYYSSQYVSQL
ncbi:hypothetical protein ABW21_db0204629 [Orbilia brochopaga]|nr:hypothetical protein ABW21_db0204629 [Drechslerella brochopaga]